MKRSFQLLTILAISSMAMFISFVGCDELVTEENYFYDTVTFVFRDSSCVEVCHSDNSFALQIADSLWLRSAHAQGYLIDTTVSGTIAISTKQCGPQCHTMQGYVNENNNTTVSTPLALDCFACHPPHTTWENSIRFTEAVSLLDGGTFDDGNSNNCVSCHHSNTTVAASFGNTYDADPNAEILITDLWGPHGSNQAEMFLGRGAYLFSAGTSTGGEKSHPGTFNNACIKCHMDITEGFSLGGHSMNLSDDIEEHVNACNVSGCHVEGSATGVSSFDTYTNTDTLGLFLDSLAVLESLMGSEGFLDQTFTVNQKDVAGIVYNYRFIMKDQSMGIHNPAYCQEIVDSTLVYLRAYIAAQNP